MVQHLHNNLETLLDLNNFSFLCFQSQAVHPFGKFWKEMLNNMANNAAISTYSHREFSHLMDLFLSFFVLILL